MKNNENKFTLKKDGKLVTNDIIKLNLHTDSFNENTREFNYEVLQGTEQVINFEGIQLFFGEVFTKGKIDFDIKFKVSFFLLTFEIIGGHGFVSKESKKTILEIPSESFSCIFLNQLDGTMYYTSSHRKYFTFLLSKEYIIDLLKCNFPKLGSQYITLLEQKTEFKVFENSKRIPFSIYNLLNEINNSYHRGEVKEAFLKAKIIEIFIEMFTLFKSDTIEKKSEDELLGVEIKKFIQKNFDKKITLDTIAKELTSNKTRLKTVFKNQFNTSIFAYKSKIQMEYAKKMFNENNINIAEIAYSIGYKNPQHFSTAFKKYYKVTPTTYLTSLEKTQKSRR